MILPGYSFRMFLITGLDRGLKFLVSSSKTKTFDLSKKILSKNI